jgi:hypothetical protein
MPTSSTPVASNFSDQQLNGPSAPSPHALFKRRNLLFGSRASWVCRGVGMLVLAGCLALLQACATSVPVFHGLGYCNVGVMPILAKRIQYGNVQWPMEEEGLLKEGDKACLYGSSITSDMYIPEMMQVTWTTTDQVRHVVDVPVRSRLTNLGAFHSIVVKFDGNQIYVIQRLRFRVGDERDIQIYPHP